jgi:hypothetical protein
MSAKYILAATLAVAASAIIMSSAHAITGRDAVGRCIDIGTDGGCIHSCSQVTGVCKVTNIDTGGTLVCPTPTAECYLERHKGKAARPGAGAKSTVGADSQ